MNKLIFFLFLFTVQIFAQIPCSSGIQGNGVDDFITVPNTDAINLRNVRDRTIEFWFKTSDITTKQILFEEGGNVNAILFYLEGGRIYLGAYRNNAGVAADRRFFRSGAGDIETDKWYHVALTLEDTTSPDLTLKWFLNGIEQDSQDGLQVNTHSGTITFLRNADNLRYPNSLVSNWTSSSVGGSTSETYSDAFTGSTATIYPYTGNVALFRIWNVARTQSQIDTNKSIFLTSETDLVAYLDSDRIYFQPDGATSISLTAFIAINNQYTTIPNTDAINLQNTRNRTVEFKFKASDLTTRQVLYEEGGNTNAITAFVEAGRFYFGVYRNNADTATNRWFFRSGSGDILFNQWHHVAITLEDTAAPDLTLKWYLDGVEQDSQDGLQVNDHSGDINIGRSGGNIRYPNSLVTGWNASSIGASSSENFNAATTSNGDANNFTGDFDLFRIWNVARTPAEIDANKNILLTTGTSLVAYQSGTQMNFQPNGGSSITETEDAVGVITWDGSDSNVWSTTTNWVGDAAPNVTRKQKVTIPNEINDPILTTEVGVGFLTINSGVEIIIQSGATLNIYYGLDNNGTITVESGGSLIYHNCNNPITGSGTFNIKKDSPSYANKKFFSYWSSPLIQTDSDPSTIFSSNPNISSSNIYLFNASISDADWAVNSGNFIPGTGYAVRYDSTGSFATTFTGKINEGGISVPVYFNTNLASTDVDNVWNSEGDNLVGNPYSSAIDWDIISTDPENSSFLEGTIYFWNQTAALVGDNDIDDYKQYNLSGGSSPGVTGKISSNQAFFLRTTSAGTLKFKPTHQVIGDNTQFYKGNIKANNPKKEGRSWFSISNGSQYSSMLVAFLKGATTKYDNLYDGPFDINNKTLGLYSLIEENKKATIQGLPKLEGENYTVNIGYIVNKTGDYTIRIDEEYIENDYQIYLEDALNNVFIDLKKEKTYMFQSNMGEFKERFKLHYTQSTLSTDDYFNPLIEKNIKVYVDKNEELQVVLTNNLANRRITIVEIYNLLGSKIGQFKPKNKRIISNYSKGIYLVKVKLDDGFIQTKKVIFY